eukprot:6015419-Karenia_brevis.AAC.1
MPMSMAIAMAMAMTMPIMMMMIQIRIWKVACAQVGFPRISRYLTWHTNLPHKENTLFNP